jgi:hypothetical protein
MSRIALGNFKIKNANISENEVTLAITEFDIIYFHGNKSMYQ